jgi:TolB-like protein
LRDKVFRRASATGIHSLAVLPLENLSGDPQQQYFADGMTEELTTELSQVGSLRVVSRTSAMRYKGTQKSVPEIARDLNVDAVVEGSVEREGDRVRITAQLVEGPTDTHLWAKGYERDFRDSLRLQDEVAQAIVNEIQLKVTPQEQARLARNDVIDPEAHEDYLRGLFDLHRRNGPDERKAIELFQAAIKKDPTYAAAYAAMADSYRALIFNSNAAPMDVLPQSEAAAKRALEIDDRLADAHVSQSTNLADYEWDWAGAEREFQTALRLNPNPPTSTPPMHISFVKRARLRTQFAKAGEQSNSTHCSRKRVFSWRNPYMRRGATTRRSPNCARPWISSRASGLHMSTSARRSLSRGILRRLSTN